MATFFDFILPFYLTQKRKNAEKNFQTKNPAGFASGA
jgi:hypothetical protein